MNHSVSLWAMMAGGIAGMTCLVAVMHRRRASKMQRMMKKVSKTMSNMASAIHQMVA